MTAKAPTFGNRNRLKPNLDSRACLINVDMWRLVGLVAKKVKTKAIFSKDCRHLRSLVSAATIIRRNRTKLKRFNFAESGALPICYCIYFNIFPPVYNLGHSLTPLEIDFVAAVIFQKFHIVARVRSRPRP